MAPITKTRSSLVEAGASESEDDLATANAGAHSRQTNGKTSANNKAKTMPRRASSATKRKAPPKAQNRQALKDRTNIQGASDTEEVDNFDEDGGKPKSKRAKTTATQKPRAAPKSKRAPAAETLAVIPETQPDAEDVSQSIEVDHDNNMDITTVPTPPHIQRFVQRPRSTSVQPLQPRPSARSASVQPGYPPPRERSGSASGAERERRAGADPETRRKLNDLTKKYENLNLKYQNLQEIGQSSAQSNFDKLKKASDQKAKDADALVVALKKEVAELKKSSISSTNASETEGMQKELQSLTSTNNSLATETANLKSSLQVAQNEVKSLEAKLIAARQQLSNMTSEQEKNNSKAKSDLNRSVGPNNTTDAAKEAKMKENLYSDLTGLIIRGVKRKEGEDEYDCIQTGRNGTLHFHLSISTDPTSTNPKTPSGLSYEEAEFAYEPLLDECRDRELMDLLPDYLTEEICFPRNHAVKFYTRVVESMTRRVVVEE